MIYLNEINWNKQMWKSLDVLRDIKNTKPIHITHKNGGKYEINTKRAEHA
jgi:hypothetical protein